MRILKKIVNSLLIYFYFPAFLLIVLTYIYFKNENINIILAYLIVGLILTYLFIIFCKFLRKQINKKDLGFNILTLIFLFLSIFFYGEIFLSNLFITIAIILFEIYLYVNIINYIISVMNKIQNPNNTFKVIIFSILFIFTGVFFIYFSLYDKDYPTLFNAFMGLFSTIIGGSLAFVGIALTIKHTNDLNREERRFQNIPYLEIAYDQCIKIFDITNFQNVKINSCIYVFRGDTIIPENFTNVYYFNPITLKNISSNNILLSGISINNQDKKLNQKIILSKNEFVKFCFSSNGYASFNEKIDNLVLLVEDILGNKYNIEFNLIIEDKHIQIDKINKGFEFKIVTINNVSLPNLKN